MKKILIAAACIGMIGSVQAQSNVKIFGIVDQYLDVSRAGENHSARVQSGGMYGSRLGVSGEEALGGSLKALFLVEAGFDADTGASGQGGVLFGRQSYVGLGGHFGQVTLGRQYSMYYDTLVNYGLGGGLAWGNATEYFNEGSMLRVNNAVKYESPSFSGLSLKGLFGAGENSEPGMRSVGNIVSVSGQYDRGPVSMNLSYSTRQTLPSNQERWTAFGTYYNFGPIKTGFVMSDARDDRGVNRNDTYEISAEIPLTNASLLLDVGHFSNRALDNANADSYSLRYDYYLSKRTTLYTGVAYIRNDPNAMYAINGSTGAGLTGAPGNNTSGLIAGIAHMF